MTKNKTKSKPVAPAKTTINYLKYLCILIFMVVLFFNLKYSFTGIKNYLLENHSFRQTQTALTSYYFCKDGFKLAYETPVVGAPWSIPFEFPLYQFIVSEIKNITNNNMDIIGRIVSLLFYYLSLLYVFLIANKYIKNFAYSLLLTSVMMLHPTYIFWSRTFMIESTALFFCLFYFYYSLKYLDNKKTILLILASAGGVLAALVKITTLVPFVIFVLVFVFVRWFKQSEIRFKIATIIQHLILGVALFLLPFLAIKFWTDFTEKYKVLNEYASKFTITKNLGDWYYGTMEQKTSLSTWENIFKLTQVSQPYFYLFIVLGLIGIFVTKMKYRYHALVCAGLYILAPAIFTNLHFIHDYYTYSNSLFLCCTIGFICVSLLENKNQILKIVGIIYLCGNLFFFNGRYKEGYYKVQKSHPNFLIPVANLVKQNTNPDDVIMVYGNDWGSEYAYYCERRTIALRNTFKSINDEDFKSIMRQNKDYNITTLVFVTYTGLFDKNFANELINYLGFKPVLQQEPYFIYHKEKQ